MAISAAFKIKSFSLISSPVPSHNNFLHSSEQFVCDTHYLQMLFQLINCLSKSFAGISAGIDNDDL